MLGIFWCKSLALTVFENIRVAIPIAKIETRHRDLWKFSKIFQTKYRTMKKLSAVGEI